MDGWEHAFMRDYKAFERGKYVEAFFKNVDWAAVEKPAEVGSAADASRTVRRRGAPRCAGACSPGGTPGTATSPGASRSAPPTRTGCGSPR